MVEEPRSTKSSVKEYYGKTLKSTEDLLTDACCTADDMPDFAKPILAKVHDEVLSKYYGCGIIMPEQLQGTQVLDLGSGSGRDCYVLSALVGETGTVVGVDMTDEQIQVANRHRQYMADQFSFKSSNVRFLKGDIESLLELDLKPESFDCIISNCVVNLAENKQAVLDGAYALLKPGGEFYFSDVYSDRRVPTPLTQDPVLYGECLSGALYVNDFQNMANQSGFRDPRVVTSRPMEIQNKSVLSKIGSIQFFSITYRLFKTTQMDWQPEDYGQAVRYLGTIDHFPNFWSLDQDHTFEKGRMIPVSGNSFRMLHESRFRDHFEFWGDYSQHYGVFQQQRVGNSVLKNNEPLVSTDHLNVKSETSSSGCC